MNKQDWYNKTFQSDVLLNKVEMLALLEDPEYRTLGWIPDWNHAEFDRAIMEVNNSFNIPEDPRLDPHWRDSDWDDILLDDWWQYIAYQYKNIKFRELFE